MNDETQAWAGPAAPLTGLAGLADHHAIERLAKIYAIGLDLRDYDLCRSAYAPDAQIEGRDGWEPVDVSLKKTYAVASSFHVTQHLIGNQYVDLQGDEVRVWSWGVDPRRAKTATRYRRRPVPGPLPAHARRLADHRTSRGDAVDGHGAATVGVLGPPPRRPTTTGRRADR